MKHFKKLGYDIPKVKCLNGKYRTPTPSRITVNVKDLLKNSTAKVTVVCDICGKFINDKEHGISYSHYNAYVRNDGEYYCKKCSTLKNSKTFKQICDEYKSQDILDRWDYDLNKSTPNDISFKTEEKCWFKCPRGIHNSELKSITGYSKNKGGMDCNYCNSIAQWGIDNICEDFVDKYWDYEKNLGNNPWHIAKSSDKKVWIRCQNKKYHGSYIINCGSFTRGSKCPYCCNHNGKVHELDSFGANNTMHDKLWSDKNEKSPYEYAPKSNKKVWWKCPDGIHEDFYRSVNNSVSSEFRCPICNYSKGEFAISQFLLKNNIKHKYQKEFDSLVGMGGKCLSYDFYLPDYSLLIEYQGKQHECYCKGFHNSVKQFKKQQEHDKRKKEYAINNNIKLLEIWYWDYENIEEILRKELQVDLV